MGGAGENCRRAAGLGANLFAEPVHFHVLERLGSEAFGDFWIDHRIVDADDNIADWIRASGMAVFTINELLGVDGSIASDILVYFDPVRFEISRCGFFSLQSPHVRRLIYLGDCIHSGGGSNDDRAAANRRKIGHILSEGEAVLSFALG
jgi:hypothetical protein